MSIIPVIRLSVEDIEAIAKARRLSKQQMGFDLDFGDLEFKPGGKGEGGASAAGGTAGSGGAGGEVKHPGSRGGKWYRTDKGRIVYGEKSEGEGVKEVSEKEAIGGRAVGRKKLVVLVDKKKKAQVAAYRKKKDAEQDAEQQERAKGLIDDDAIEVGDRVRYVRNFEHRWKPKEIEGDVLQRGEESGSDDGKVKSRFIIRTPQREESVDGFEGKFYKIEKNKKTKKDSENQGKPIGRVVFKNGDFELGDFIELESKDGSIFVGEVKKRGLENGTTPMIIANSVIKRFGAKIISNQVVGRLKKITQDDVDKFKKKTNLELDNKANEERKAYDAENEARRRRMRGD